jgi:hypothetical protein
MSASLTALSSKGKVIRAGPFKRPECSKKPTPPEKTAIFFKGISAGGTAADGTGIDTSCADWLAKGLINTIMNKQKRADFFIQDTPLIKWREARDEG